MDFFALLLVQELTGKIPVEMPLDPGQPPPVIRRRVGTTFPVSPKVAKDKVCDCCNFSVVFL